MKTTKSIALMMLGAGAVLAYQKYNKPIKHAIKDEYHAMKDTLEDMM